MNREQAAESAREFLAARRPVSPPTIVVRPEWATEYAWAWTVRFDTQEHLETGDPKYQVINALVVVPKDGSEVSTMPSAFTWEQKQEYLATGRWPLR